jgi:hypothetical protein
MRRGGLAALAFAACGLVAAGAEEPGTLEARVRDSVAAVRSLEEFYRQSEDPREQAGALQSILARAAWLEQVAGLQDARANARLALARFELRGFLAPLRYGFLAEGMGTAAAEATARRPRSGELPEALAPFANRLLYLHLQNTSRRPWLLAGRPFVEVLRRLEGPVRVSVPAPDGLPKELQPFASFFAWPARLAPGEAAQRLVWLPDAEAPLVALGVDLREEGDREEPAHTLRVVFLEAQDEEAYRRARREAERLEAAMQAERERRPREKSKAAPPARDPPPAVESVPGEKLPRPLGVVERAGADEIIQVRLKEGEAFQGGEILRVRQGKRWVGRVRMPEHRVGAEKGDEKVVWTTIVEGSREALIDGTLYPQE